MLLGTYPRSLIEALAVHTVLEKLGYSKKDEIFLLLSGNDVWVQLSADGKVGNIRIDSMELSIHEMEKKWKELVLEWNEGGTMTQEDKDILVQSSNTWNMMREQIVLALTLHGFNRWVLPSTSYVM